MPKRSSISVLPLALLLMSGCQQGVKFANQTVDAALPSDYANRTRIANSADYRFNMSQNIGAILEQDTTKPGQYRLSATSVILPAGFVPDETILAKEDNQIYSGKITQGGSISANYVTIGVSLTLDQAADISIVDVSRAEIPTPQIPVTLLTNYVSHKPDRKQYWIKSLLLSRILKQIYTKEDANASGSGPAFGADGKVYHTTSAQQNDFNLAAVLIDLDTFRSGVAPPASPGAGGAANVPGVVVLPPICAQPRTARGQPGSITASGC